MKTKKRRVTRTIAHLLHDAGVFGTAGRRDASVESTACAVDIHSEHTRTVDFVSFALQTVNGEFLRVTERSTDDDGERRVRDVLVVELDRHLIFTWLGTDVRHAARAVLAIEEVDLRLRRALDGNGETASACLSRVNIEFV